MVHGTIICKQLNGPVLISLKQSCLGRNRKKNWPGWARAKILYFVSRRAKLGRNFNLPFGLGRAWTKILISFLGPGRNFFLYFGLDRAEILAMRAGPGPD